MIVYRNRKIIVNFLIINVVILFSLSLSVFTVAHQRMNFIYYSCTA